MTYAHVPPESRTGSLAPSSVVDPAAVDNWLEEAWDLGSMTLAAEGVVHEGLHGPGPTGPPLVADAAWTQLQAAIEEWPSGTSTPRRPDEPDINQSQFDEPVQRLRRWTGLPMTDLAALLDVSRRTLYDWLSGVQPQLENRERLGRLVDIIGAVATSTPPETVAAWLRQHAGPRHAGPVDVDELAVAVRESVGGNELPNLERLEGELEGAPVGSLETDELRAFLERRALPRPVVQAQAWEPREIMPAADDDA